MENNLIGHPVFCNVRGICVKQIQLRGHPKSAPESMRNLTRWRCPQVAAACSGVHFSVSVALGSPPYEMSSCIISSLSSMQHCKCEKRIRMMDLIFYYSMSMNV